MKLWQMILFAMMVIALTSAAQQTPPPEPEMADVFYRLDGDKLIPLERQAAAIHGSAHGFIVMSMKSASEFPGSKSPVRFRSGGHLDLIVRSAIPTSAIDPNVIFALRKLNSKKK